MNVLALCSGIGGLELGLHLAEPRSRCVCYVEREAFAVACLVRAMEAGYLAPAPVWSDLTTFRGREWRGLVDCVTAGFPCQPWSVAGARRGTADERWIWDSIATIIRDVGPRFVFLENVPGLLVGGVEHVLGSLASLGFDAEWGVFSCREVGGSHLRERVFLLAHTRCQRPGRHQQEPITGSGREADIGHGEPAVVYAHGRKYGGPTGHGQACVGEPGDDMGDTQNRSTQSCVLSLWPPGPDGEWRDIDPRLWPIEPRVRRVADGVPTGLDRLRALGNGVVPLVAAHAWRTLLRNGR